MEFRKMADKAYERALATENELRETKYREDEEYIREKLEAAGIDAVYKQGHAEVGGLVVSKFSYFEMKGLEFKGYCHHCNLEFTKQAFDGWDIYSTAGELYYEIDEHEAFCDGNQTVEAKNKVKNYKRLQDISINDFSDIEGYMSVLATEMMIITKRIDSIISIIESIYDEE